MPDIIQSRLAELGITIPKAAVPVANYVATATSGNQLFVSGQLPFHNGRLLATGKVGLNVDTEKASQAAEACACNVLAQAKAALGDLEKIRKIIKITVFIAVDPGFTNIPQVANGASDLLVRIFGDAGRHARSAVGVAALPLDATVEIEAILEV